MDRLDSMWMPPPHLAFGRVAWVNDRTFLSVHPPLLGSGRAPWNAMVADSASLRWVLVWLLPATNAWNRRFPVILKDSRSKNIDKACKTALFRVFSRFQTASESPTASDPVPASAPIGRLPYPGPAGVESIEVNICLVNNV